jgi:drug/metabolite transporter (DMT)-like permease
VSRARIATVLLTASCTIWGVTFLLMEMGTESLHRDLGAGHAFAVGALFIFLRFAVATVLLPIAIPSSLRRLDATAWGQGLGLALPFTAGFLLQIYGLDQADVSPGESAFLTSLYVVATPILAGLWQRRWPAAGVLVGVPLATLGAAFISGPPQGLSSGAWSTVACAVAFAGQIVVTDRASRRADPMALTFAMLAWSVLFTGVAFLLAPGGIDMLGPGLGRALVRPRLVGSLAFCAVLATVVVVPLLNRWQKELSPGRAAIVYSAEPVFAALVSIAAGRDHVSGWLLFGAGMIVLANLAAALWPERARPD